MYTPSFNQFRRIFLFVLFISCKTINAKVIQGYFVTNDNDTVKADLKIPIVDKYFIDFIKIQQTVKCELLTGEKLKLTPDKIKEVVFRFREQKIKLKSFSNTLKLKAAGGGFKENVFLIELIKGPYIDSYLYFTGAGTSNLAAHGESFSSSKGERRNVMKDSEDIAKLNFEGSTNYIFKKKKEPLFTPSIQTFDTDLAEFLKTCKAIAEKLNNIDLKQYKVSDIVEQYNLCKQ